ncbi:MAG: CBS domain-containing protein [Anaerolineaceae bacterium]
MSTLRHILQVKGNDVWSISPNASVFDALRLMADKDIGALLVMETDHLVGMISERDYARKVILQGKSSKETRVGEIMTSKVISIHPDQTVQECMGLMNDHRIRHVPVVENEHVLGVVSIGDVLKDIIYMQKRRIKEMETRLTSSGPDN